MSKAKRKPQTEKPMNIPNPLIVDEGEFNRVLDKMIQTPPIPMEKMKRRKNPESDPRYLSVFPALLKPKK